MLRMINWGEILRCVECDIVVFDGQEFFGCPHFVGVKTNQGFSLICRKTDGEWVVEEDELVTVIPDENSWTLWCHVDDWEIVVTEDVFEHIPKADKP